jgi:DNA mismatch repair protein MutS
MKLIDQYFDYTEQHKKEYGEKTIVLMQVGSFFEIYGIKHPDYTHHIGSQVDEIAKICELNVSVKPKLFVSHCANDAQKYNVVMAGFCTYVLDKYSNKINEAGYTCAVYVQKEGKDNKNDKGEVERELFGIFSPGTYFKEDINTNTNHIMCISILHRKPSRFTTNNSFYYGLSCVDVITGYTNVAEYNEKYFKSLTTFDELEKYYSIYNPNELLFCYDSSNIEGEQIDKIIKYVGMTAKVIRKIDMNDADSPLGIRSKRCQEQIRQNEIIKKYYADKGEDYQYILGSLFEYHCGAHSFCFLLDYINTLNDGLTKKIKAPLINNHDDSMVLANHSLKQLNILSSSANDIHASNRLSSVSKFINKCVTAMGRRQLNKIISNPITSCDILTREYEKVEYVYDNLQNFQFIRREFSHVVDMEKMFRKIVLHKVVPHDISVIAENIEVFNTVFEKVKCDEYLSLSEDSRVFDVNELEHAHKSINQLIYGTVNVDICQSCTGGDPFTTNFFVRGTYPDLDECEKQYMESIDKLEAFRKYLSDQIKSQEGKPKDIEYCKIHETNKSGMYIKTTDTRAKKLMKASAAQKSSVPTGAVHISYNSSYDNKKKSIYIKVNSIKTEKRGSDTHITSAIIRNVCADIETYKTQLREILKDKFKDFVEELQKIQDAFDQINAFIIDMDILVAKAHLANKYNYCKPEIDSDAETAFLDAKDMRHVLIEQINNSELYIPNDVTLGRENSDKGILLFGTNAVGKSSLIKSIGIVVVMAQAGFFVPCSSFVFKPYKYIFTRILGNDNIFKGLSTFAVEMSELRTILRLSDKDSLVLGDELCSGTELGSAVSIFVAGLTQLHDRGSSFIFATHFHEITKMNEIAVLDGLKMKHMSVYYDAELDALVYNRLLRDGPGNNMYGLEVCKSLNLPQDFIDLAYKVREKHIDATPVALQGKSSYNAKKLRGGECEMCGKPSVEVHHLQHQKDADDKGMIGHFHKNHVANLMNVCEDCHNQFHKTDDQYKRVKTNKGMMIQKI